MALLDTGWVNSAPLIEAALHALDRGRADVEQVVRPRSPTGYRHSSQCRQGNPNGYRDGLLIVELKLGWERAAEDPSTAPEQVVDDTAGARHRR